MKLQNRRHWLTHPFNGFLLLRCDLDVVNWRSLFSGRSHVPHLRSVAAFTHRLVQHLDEPLLVLTDLLEKRNGRGEGAQWGGGVKLSKKVDVSGRERVWRAAVTCSSCGFSLPSCCSSAGSRAGFRWMACLMCTNWGWVRRNASGFSPGNRHRDKRARIYFRQKWCILGKSVEGIY